MTSRSVRRTGSTTGSAAGPGDRPHLPPVDKESSRRTARKAPLGWLPWLLGGLLVLTLLAAALLARAADGGSGDPAAGGAGSTTASERSGAGGGEGSALTAGGQDLLAVEGGRLGSLAESEASGTAQVESVVADEGFWLGPDAGNRVFVFLTPQARRSAGESGFQVEVGQTVTLRGVVRPSSPEFAQSAGVTDAEGSRQLVEQGGYVEATEVRLAS